MEKILFRYLRLEKVLNKEYQYKNFYQGKYCNPMDIYFYIDSTVNNNYLEVFNVFDRNSNFESF